MENCLWYSYVVISVVVLVMVPRNQDLNAATSGVILGKVQQNQDGNAPISVAQQVRVQKIRD
jgi:hypothetical protein